MPEVSRERRANEVLRLRSEGVAYRDIAARLGLGINQCRRTVENAWARRRRDYAPEQHQMEVLNDIEDTLDILRPWIMGEAVPGEDPPPLTKDLWRDWWKALKAKRQFLGLDAPKRTHVMTQEVREEPFNQHAAERLARLAACGACQPL